MYDIVCNSWVSLILNDYLGTNCNMARKHICRVTEHLPGRECYAPSTWNFFSLHCKGTEFILKGCWIPYWSGCGAAVIAQICKMHQNDLTDTYNMVSGMPGHSVHGCFTESMYTPSSSKFSMMVFLENDISKVSRGGWNHLTHMLQV